MRRSRRGGFKGIEPAQLAISVLIERARIRPEIIASEVNMLPARRRDVGQQSYVNRAAFRGHRAEDSSKIDRIPQHDRGGEERYS